MNDLGLPKPNAYSRDSDLWDINTTLSTALVPLYTFIVLVLLAVGGYAIYLMVLNETGNQCLEASKILHTNTKYLHVYNSNVVPYNPVNLTTESGSFIDCLTACNDNDDCKAVSYSSSSKTCNQVFRSYLGVTEDNRLSDHIVVGPVIDETTPVDIHTYIKPGTSYVELVGRLEGAHAFPDIRVVV